MMDTLTRRQRSERMRRVPTRDTRPELTVRRMVFSMGYRYRLHRADLPGTPDLVLPRLRKVIFVHGCFWHRHSCRQGQSMPSTNRDFWTDKFEANRRRDRRVRDQLRRAGWTCLVVWECETRTEQRREVLQLRLRRFLQV